MSGNPHDINVDPPLRHISQIYERLGASCLTASATQSPQSVTAAPSRCCCHLDCLPACYGVAEGGVGFELWVLIPFPPLRRLSASSPTGRALTITLGCAGMHTTSERRARAIAPTGARCVLTQSVDLVRELQGRGLDLSTALALLDASPALRFQVRTRWSKSNRLFYKAEVSSLERGQLQFILHYFKCKSSCLGVRTLWPPHALRRQRSPCPC